MQTSIEVDDDLLDAAMNLTGLSSKAAAVAEALRRLVVEHERRTAIADLAGIGWSGDLDAMRADRQAR